MDKFHHEEPYYPAIVSNEWIEEEPVEVQGENPKVGPEEYQEIDYDGENSDEETDKHEGTGGILCEPYFSEIIPNQHIVQEDPIDRLWSLEEEVATTRQQLIATEAREALVEHRAE